MAKRLRSLIILQQIILVYRYNQKKISFIVDNVSFKGGKVTAPGGNVQLGGLAALGKISIKRKPIFTSISNQEITQ